MKVLDYLNPLAAQGGNEYALSKLTEEFGIKVKYDEKYDLYLLNYCQITSPKTHEIVKECRSLVLEASDLCYGFWVVSRSFDRFFNHGELQSEVDNQPLQEMVAHEKLDGSLVTVFFYKGEWIYRTRSMIMPEGKVNGFDASWKEVIEDALGPLTLEGWNLYHQSLIFEVTSPENRVVVRYPERKATLLAIRDSNGKYSHRYFCDIVAEFNSWGRPKQYHFDTLQQVSVALKELPNLEEGYVMYSLENNSPQVKIKNPAYVAAHHLRGEGLNPKRVMDLILMGETSEYLSIFPEDKAIFKPYQEAYALLWVMVDALMDETKLIEDRKEFALKVKDHPISVILFSIKNGLTKEDAWGKITTQSKYRMIEAYLQVIKSLEDGEGETK